jgi:tetratricopeptide (TPR) repeat protein
MLRTIALFLVTALAVLLTPTTSGADDDRLPDAKRLYESASYEEALKLLGDAASMDADAVDQYRALCFLALGQTEDANRTIERLVRRRPQFTFNAADTPPRLITLHRTVRHRLLPDILKARYEVAKASFEAGRDRDASAQFHDVIVMLTDKESAADVDTLSDMETLADGFLVLTEQRMRAQARAEEIPRPIESTGVPSFTAIERQPVPDQPRAGRESQRVLPPVPLDQSLPFWNPPDGLKTLTFHGAMDIVIDETGAVSSAVIVRSINKLYDSQLLDAAWRWKFVPATLNATPVSFQKTIDVTLGPRQ